MKKIYLLIILIISFVGVASAQTTHDKISYQSVVRTGDNHLVYDTWVTVTVSIANGDAPSTVVYSEKHTVLSNANGLISFLIGDGVDKAGDWNAVKWNRAEITLVTNVNGNELSTHTYPLSAVPYALYAKGADAAAYADSVDMDVVQDYLDQHGYLPEEPQVLSISNDTIFLTRGGYVVLPAGFSGNYNDLTNKPDLKPVATSGDYNDLVNKPTKSDLCDSVKDCVTGWISDSTRMVFDTLHNYYATKNALRDTAEAIRGALVDTAGNIRGALVDTASDIRGALVDTAAAIRADMGDAAHDAKITIQKNGVTVGDFTLNQSTPDTIDITVPTKVTDLEDAGNYVTNAKLSDTLKAYTTTSQIDTLLGDYATITYVKDTLKAYYDTTLTKKAIHDTANALRGEFPTVNDGQITIAVNRGTVTNPSFTVNQEAGQVVTINIPEEVINNGQLTIITEDDTTRFTANQSGNDTVNLSDFVTTARLNDTLKAYTTTDKIDTIVNKHHFLTSDSALIVRMRDSIQKVNAHVSADSLVLANRIHADSLKLATRMDTLLKHVCDSVKPCVTDWMNDTLKAYTTTDEIDSIVNKHHFLTSDSALIVRMRDSIQKVNAHVSADSLVLANRIHADSLKLATRMDTLLKHVCDSVKPCVTGWINDTLNAYTTTNEIDSIVNKHHFLTSDSTLIVRMRDSIQKVNAHVSADSLVLATRMDTLLKHVCDSVKPCVTDWMNDTLKAYTTTDEIDSIVNKHHFLTSDSMLIVRMRDSIQKVNAHVSADSLVLANRIHADSMKLSTRMDTLLKHVCDSVKPCVTDWMNDTLKAYTTTNKIDTIVDKHHFLTSDSALIIRMRDSIQKVNAHVSADSLVLATRMDTLLKHVCDSVKPCVTGWMNDTLNAYTTTDEIDSIVNKHHFLTSDSTLIVRMRDSIQKVNAHVSADSLVLATRMDTLLKHVCDSVKPCVTDWMNDTLKAYTTTNAIDSIVNKHHFLTSDSALIVRMRDSIQKVNTHVSADSLVLATRMDTLLKHVCDTVKPCVTGWMNDTLSAYYTKTQVDSADSEVRSEIGKGTLTITYGTNPTTTVQFGANQDTNTTVTIPTPPTPTYGTLTITKNNDETVGTFIANVDNTININVPTCDSLANCAFIKDILDRLVKLERQNDSLARELDKMKPLLTLAGPQKDTVCAGSAKPVTYTATFHNCSSSDYTLAWKVNGTDSSNVTGSELILNVETAGQYKVVCIATRSDSTFVTDTVTTTVTVDNDVPSFTIAIEGLKVTLSDVVNTATIQWDTDSLPVHSSGTSATHTYAVADTITITAISERGCTFTKDTILQPIKPEVTTVSIPTETIKATEAKVNGKLNSDGGIPTTRRGVLYSISNSTPRLGAAGVDSVINGAGMGDFTCDLRRLVPCSPYYVCAFAINEVDTAYGEVKLFTTSSFTCGDTLIDIDDNEYETLLLGSQCWMKQNLRTTRYADGTEIPLTTSTTASSEPYRYAPDSNLTTYGYLYNWAAAARGNASALNPSGVQGACPDGWHLPSDAEWTQLTDFVASDNANVCDHNPEYIIKALATQQEWGTCPGSGCNVCINSSTNNNTQFSILPAGTWNNGSGDFGPTLGYDGGHTIFTSATGYDATHIWTRQIYTEFLEFRRDGYDKSIGLSVRCVLDTCPLDNTDYKPTVSAVTVTSTGGTKVNMAANVSSDGGATVSERGVCWGTASQPTTGSDHIASGTGIGDFSVNVTTLTPDTTYYIRAYATNSVGTAYGAEVIIEMPGAPVVTTDSIPEGTIAAFKAKVYSTVTSDGGADVTARGICWSTSHNPTVANDTTLNVGGVGSYVASLMGLTPETTYYARAYAINSIDTAYGEERYFTTPLLSLDIISDAAATASLCGDPSKTVTYTAEPSSGDISDFSYVWTCSGGTISGPSDSSTVAITYNSAATYTVTCTATLKTNASISFSKTTSTTINSGGTRIYLGMCNESLTINSVYDINNNNYRWANVSSISWGDGSSENLTSANFSHTYTSPGVYTVTITSNIGSCEVKRSFAMGEIVPHPCTVAVAHTNTSKYTLSTGGLETTNSEGKVTAVTDNDTNTYKVVQIGSQCWMAENLRTTKFPNGNEIPLDTSTSSTTAYRYNPIIDAVEPYGYFYNWKAVMNDAPASSLSPSGVRGICPMGWHVPSDDEWTTMELEVNGPFSGTDTSCRGDHAAKLSSRCDWKLNYATYVKSTPGDYSYPERNSSCFGALTTGWFGASNQYSMSTRFWTSSSIGTNIFYREIAYNLAYVKRWLVSSDQGYSLRCVRDEGTAEPLSVTTNVATDIAQTSAILNGSISNPDPDNINITDKGFEWKATDGSYAPAIVDDATLTYNLAGLNPNTGYTFRAFATTPDGTVYGEEQSFITRADHFTVVTEPVTNISQTSATLHCSIANPDPATISISERGFEWKEATGSTYEKVIVSDATQDYNLTMSYDLAGLTPNKSYTVRAYATIPSGTVYGDEVNFTTLPYRRILLDTIQHDFVAQYGDTLVDELNTTLHPVKISIAGGATVTLRNAIINGTNSTDCKWAGISCEEGNATIVLEETNIVRGFYQDYPGVYVAQNKTLTIQGIGSLDASSNGKGAGIGGGNTISCGNIVINGGTINATGDYGAAGIGSGDKASCGSIIINGENVTAQGGAGGAGIGAGMGVYGSSTCGDITISGGNVTALGGENGAGIGTGTGYYSSSECGDIIIGGGNVTAQGGGGCAGIGAGISFYDNSTCGSITISGGTVDAQGGESGAGVGAGYAYFSYYSSTCGDISINGGTVDAQGGESGAGIGAGMGDGGPSVCGDINIAGGEVTATGGSASNEGGGGTGIGTGSTTDEPDSESVCGNITIESSVTRVTVIKGEGANSIGKDRVDNDDTTCGTVTIGGTVYDNGISESPFTYQP